MVSESNFEFCCGGADVLELAFLESQVRLGLIEYDFPVLKLLKCLKLIKSMP